MFNSPAPNELIIWELAERYHWTLDYIKSISMGDIKDHFEIEDAKRKVREIKR